MSAAKASEFFGSNLKASPSIPIAEVMYITNEQVRKERKKERKVVKGKEESNKLSI